MKKEIKKIEKQLKRIDKQLIKKHEKLKKFSFIKLLKLVNLLIKHFINYLINKRKKKE